MFAVTTQMSPAAAVVDRVNFHASVVLMTSCHAVVVYYGSKRLLFGS